MSGNVGGTDRNPVNINTRKNLTKLDDLIGQSIKGSVWAKYDLVENGGNGNEFFDEHEILAIKNYLSHASDVPPEVLAYFEAEAEKSQTQQENSNQVYTSYIVQPGDTFIAIAKRIGLTGQEAKAYAEELKNHLQAEGKLDKKGWMHAGQSIQLPGEHNAALKKNEDYTEDVNVIQKRYAQKTETNKLKTQYPKALLDRAAQIKKDGGAYNLVKNDDGTFSIVQTSGGSYMSKNKIANIELQYDKSGKMLCQRNIYQNGEIRKGVYKDGKMNWTKVAVPVKSGKNTISVPVNAKNRADAMVKAGDKCRIVKQKDGTFMIEKTGGTSMAKYGITRIEILYDRDGKLLGQNDYYKNGSKRIGTMKNGKMSWTNVAAPAKPASAAKPQAAAAPENTFANKASFFDLYKPVLAPGELAYPKEVQDFILENRAKGIEYNVLKSGRSYKLFVDMSRTKGVFTGVDLSPKSFKVDVPFNVADKMEALKKTDAAMVKNRENGSYTITQTNDIPEGVKSITYKYNSEGDFQYQLNASATDKSVMIGQMKNGKLVFKQFKNARGILQQIPDNVTNKLNEMKQDGGQAQLIKGYETFTIIQTAGIYLKQNGLSKVEYKFNPFGVKIEQVNTYANGRSEKYYDLSKNGKDAAHMPNPIKMKLPDQYLGKDSGDEQMLYGLNTKGPKDTAQRFSKALADNKANLMATLRLTNEEYDNLAIMAMGLAEQETHFGQEKYVDTTGGEHTQDGLTDRAYVKKQVNQHHWDESERAKHSQGITQINYADAVSNETVRKIFYNNGIKSFDDFISSPEKQAIATMVLLKYKKNTAEGPTWQARLKQNNAKIADPNKRLTTNDVIALLWNGAGGVVKRMSEGEIITIDTEKKKSGDINLKNPANWKNMDFNVYLLGATYAKNVRAYSDVFFGDPATQKSGALHTTKTDNVAGALGATIQSNLGFVGEVVFMPKGLNTASAKQLVSENTQLSENSKKLLMSYISDGLVGFGGKNGLTKDEAMSISDSDVALMTEQIDAIKTGKSTAMEAGRNFEVNYLRSREFTVSNASINQANKISLTRSTTPINNKLLPQLTFEIHKSFYSKKPRHTARYSSPDTNFFAVIRSQGVNPYLANGEIIADRYRVAAEYAEYTATELLESGGACKNGVSVDIECCLGIDHRKIRGVGGRSIPSAKLLTEFYNAHPEVFTPIKYVDNGNGTSRELNASDVDNLPCGYFGVFTPGEGYEKEHGHAFISDGFGGCFADEHDNGKWAHFRNGKGEHGKLDVYGLTNSVATVYSEKLGRTVNVPLNINPWYLLPEFRELQEQECKRRGLKLPEYKEEFPI